MHCGELGVYSPQFVRTMSLRLRRTNPRAQSGAPEAPRRSTGPPKTLFLRKNGASGWNTKLRAAFRRCSNKLERKECVDGTNTTGVRSRIVRSKSTPTV